MEGPDGWQALSGLEGSSYKRRPGRLRPLQFQMVCERPPRSHTILNCSWALREFQRRVWDSGIFQVHHVGKVILFDAPWRLRSLLWQFRNRALHITRGEMFDETGGRHRGLRVSWRYLGIAILIHVLDKTRDVGANEVCLQCPRRVDVAENGCQVRHVREHHALVR